MFKKAGLKYKFLVLGTSGVILVVVLGSYYLHSLIQNNPQNAANYITLISVGYIVIGIAALLIFARIMIRPVVSLTKKVNAVREGNLDVSLKNIQDRTFVDEMDILYDGFAHMIQSLKINIQELTSAKENALSSSRELAENSKILQTIFNGIPDGVMIIDKNFKVVASNPVMQKIMGHAKGDIVGESCYKMCTGTESHCSFCNADDVFEKGKARYTYCTKNLFNTNEEKVFEVHNFPLFNKEGEVSQILEYIKDVTEAVNMRTDLEHTQRLADIGQMASKVAHEVRNPLNAIKGAAHYLHGEVNDPEAKSYLDLIEEQAERVNAVTTQLLSLSKPLEHVLKIGEIEGALNRALQVTRPQLMHKKIKIEMNVSKNLPKIMFNEGQIEQAFINLLFNSIDAMEQGGLIKISVKPDFSNGEDSANSIIISFSDTGTGLKNFEMNQLLKPFFTTKTQGTGLGLTIVKRIIDNHKGTFLLKNAEGKGTEAILTLPLEKN
ncbi:MAG: sensor histidine kinase [Calditrichaeota bacterium]|nr:MAG: sensor histidine kinase [Calditrichota bacterium]MBL1207073.1 sensor histidine kinase [Calditrichota bacterium]NOG46903.1 PAS domain-containing protein [Calditrichota bacterium]